MSGRIVHFEVPVDDAARARAFYAEVFDWSINEMPELGYSLVTTGPSGEKGPTEPGYINGGMLPRNEVATSPVLTVDVADIEATLAAVTERGGEVLAGKNPVADMGFTAYFKDSEGNVMGLWQTA